MAKISFFESLINKLEKNEDVTSREVLTLAEDSSTRQFLFCILTEDKKIQLFPAEYYTIEKAAESNLINWLEFPTEISAVPDEIALLQKVTLHEEDKPLDYYVFKFRMYKPHWAEKDGWMMGVVGPYSNHSKPYDLMSGTFSRFTLLNDCTPEKEVEWVHNNISI